jgi:hypothetical protein
VWVFIFLIRKPACHEEKTKVNFHGIYQSSKDPELVFSSSNLFFVKITKSKALEAILFFKQIKGSSMIQCQQF